MFIYYRVCHMMLQYMRSSFLIPCYNLIFPRTARDEELTSSVSHVVAATAPSAAMPVEAPRVHRG